MGASLVFVAPAWNRETATTIVANVLTLVVLSSVARLILGDFRRVAEDGDRARAEATELEHAPGLGPGDLLEYWPDPLTRAAPPAVAEQRSEPWWRLRPTR